MVNGEGIFLLSLLLIFVFMLYYLIRQEQRHTKGMESFFHAATHEMKTPLTGITSLLETLRAGRVPQSEREHLLDLGLTNCHLLEHRIENVLIAGGLQTGRQRAYITPTALSPLLKAFVEHRRSMLTGRPEHISIKNENVDPEYKLYADPDLVRVALENLVDNSFKYGGDEPRVEIHVTCRDEYAHIAVKDWGIGFPNTLSKELFSPYRREMPNNVELQHGTGLGLSIARDLTRTMGGDIDAFSDGPGKGATFTIRLPLTDEVVTG